ncbi:MAG: hypothetical protein ABR905_16545 [Terracidiphilus sp.]
MTQFQTNRASSREPYVSSAAALLCLVLLALLALVQVAHIHPLDTDADHCQLCIAMHSAAPVAAVPTAVVLVRLWRAGQADEARAEVRHWHPKLFTRPPPTGC